MHGYQVKLLWKKLFELHELIRTQNWLQLKRTARITDEVIESAKIEIEEYPGEMTVCPFDEFTDAVRLGDFDGFKTDCMAQFWFDNEESDLSMECNVEFYGKEIKRITIEQIHVF